MTDDAKETEVPSLPTPRIALVDGATTTPLSAEALVVALFACGFVILRDPAGKILDVRLDRDKVVELAKMAQTNLVDKGLPIEVQVGRIARPTNNGGGLVAP